MFLVLTSTKGEQHGTFYSSIKNAPLWAHVVVSDQNNNSAEKLRVMLCLRGAGAHATLLWVFRRCG